MRIRTLLAAGAIALLPLGAAACGGGDDAPATTAATPAPPAPPPPPPADPESPRTQPIEGTTGPGGRVVPPGPWDPGGLTGIVNQLTKQLGYRPSFLEIGAYDSYAFFEVQDKRIPRNVDQYTWRDGQITGPVPVRLSGNIRDLPANLFTARDVNLAAVPRLVRRGNQIPIEGSQTGGVLIKRFLPFSPEIRFFVNVSGTRESKQLRANARGRVTEII
jgi:hypothetical protein